MGNDMFRFNHHQSLVGFHLNQGCHHPRIVFIQCISDINGAMRCRATARGVSETCGSQVAIEANRWRGGCWKYKNLLTRWQLNTTPQNGGTPEKDLEIHMDAAGYLQTNYLVPPKTCIDIALGCVPLDESSFQFSTFP